MGLIEKKPVRLSEPMPRIYFYIVTAFVIWATWHTLSLVVLHQSTLSLPRLIVRLSTLVVMELFVFYRTFLSYTN